MPWEASNQAQGFEGKLYIGPAGSTASTLVENCTDVSYSVEPSEGNTTARGDGSGPPPETGDVVSLKFSADWTMINDKTDAVLQTILAQWAVGGRIAVRMKDYAAGKGPDLDCNIKVENGQPLNGEQTYKISVTPSRGSGRKPQFYV